MLINFKKVALLSFVVFFLLPLAAKAQESTVDGGVVYLYDSTQGNGKNGIIYPAGATKIEKVYIFFHGLNPPACTINCHRIDPIVACNEFRLCEKVGQLKNIAILFPQMDPRSGENPGLFTKAKFDAYISEAMTELHAKLYDSPSTIFAIAGHSAGAGVMVKYLEYFTVDEALVFDGCYSTWCNKIILSSKAKKKSVYIATTNNYDTYNQIARQNDTNAKVLKINTSHYQVPGKCFSDHILNNNCIETASSVTASTTEQPPALLKLINELEVDKPTLAISIPGLNFSNISSSIENGSAFIHLAWLPEFITIIYRFGIIIINIVAVIIIILAGLQILTSGGGAGTSQGYKKISHAVIGLIIAWTSYVMLYTINPWLVDFSALKVQLVERQWVPEPEEPSDEPLTNLASTPTSAPKNGYCVDPQTLITIKDIPYIKSQASPNQVDRALIPALKKAGELAAQTTDPQTGKKFDGLIVVSAVRTLTRQLELFEQALKKYGGNEEVARSHVGKPQGCGTGSSHLLGRAVDIHLILDGKRLPSDKMTEVRINLFQDAIMTPAGWVRYCPEWWHFELGSSNKALRSTKCDRPYGTGNARLKK